MRALARVQFWQQLLASILFFKLIFCLTATSFPAFTRPSKVFHICHHRFSASMHFHTHEPRPRVTRHTSHVTRHTSHAGMLVVEEMGGFTSGGVNFDAKTHRA